MCVLKLLFLLFIFLYIFSCGFVTFDKVESAEKAIADVSNLIINSIIADMNQVGLDHMMD